MLHTKDSVLVVVGNNPIYFLKACDHIQGRHISNFIVMDVVDVIIIGVQDVTRRFY